MFDDVLLFSLRFVFQSPLYVTLYGRFSKLFSTSSNVLINVQHSYLYSIMAGDLFCCLDSSSRPEMLGFAFCMVESSQATRGSRHLTPESLHRCIEW